MTTRFSGEFFIPDAAPVRLKDDHLARYRFAAQYARNRRVLDIACGTGYGSHHLAEAGASSVIGVDLSTEALAIAQERYAHSNVIFQQGNIYDFSPPWTPEVITSFETIEHVPDYKQALENLYRISGKGTLLLISSPNRIVTSPKANTLADKPSNPYHTQEFTPNELAAELAAVGFHVEKTVYGQRIQPKFFTRWLRRPYRKLFRPEERLSPEVTPLRSGIPRYFVLLAYK